MDTLLGVLGGAIVALLAEPVRHWLWSPRLDLAFGSGEDFISPTEERGTGLVKREATYCRIRVRNQSFPLAKSCRAFPDQCRACG
jgi:hypothetical protein